MRKWHSKPVSFVALALVAVLLFSAATIASPHDHASGSVCQVCHASHLVTVDIHPPNLSDPLRVFEVRRPHNPLLSYLEGVASDHASRAPPPGSNSPVA